MKPSTGFFGLTWGASLCFPKSLPNIYAPVSPPHAVRNTMIMYERPCASSERRIVNVEKKSDMTTVMQNRGQRFSNPISFENPKMAMRNMMPASAKRSVKRQLTLVCGMN